MLSDKEFWKKLIEEALSNKAEYNFLDFKLDLSEKNERTKEHINAFGNLERGGCFVFGVKDFKPIGVNSPGDDLVMKIGNLAKNTQEPSLSIDAFPLAIDRKQLLCIHVLPSASSPVFIKDRAPLGGTACFKRSGASTIPMAIQEIKDLLVNFSNNYYDESIVETGNIEELDFVYLIDLLPGLEKEKITTQKNIAILLEQRILMKRNDTPEITVAGWLCFAKQPQACRQFRNSYIEFQVFRGIARDTPIKKYEIKGCLPQQIKQAVELLQQNNWAVPKILGIKREDLPAYSAQALREVVINSIVHRDYRKMHQPVKIAVFDNRIEIENPGNLMPGLTIFNLIHKRDWRNPLLAELMKKFGFGEMDGQGIDRLYAATLAIKVPPPLFINHENSFKVILSAPKSFSEFTPEEKRLMVIILMIVHGQVDNESVRNCFDISSEKAGTLIKSMVAEKILRFDGHSRKYAKYFFTEQYREKVFE